MEISNLIWNSALANVAINLKAIDKIANRIHDKKTHIYRGNYQRDRDRILYTASFRRLIGKTQVFNPGIGEHYRNRLTHTLEVIQIATTISKCLGLNLELTEAIALGHDIGHAPFGHVGERTLNYIMNNCDVLENYKIVLNKGQKGFKHNLQGLRILYNTEKYSRKYEGIDITNDTLWGILNHTTIKMKKCDNLCANKKYCLMKRDRQGFECKNINNDEACLDFSFYDQYIDQLKDNCWTFEAYVVKYADEIAQRHHDIEDGIISNIFDPLSFINIFHEAFDKSACYTKKKENEVKNIREEINKANNSYHEYEYLLPLLSKFIIEFYVSNYIFAIAKKLKRLINKYSINSSSDFYGKKSKIFEEYGKEEGIDNSVMSFNDEFNNRDEKVKDLLYKRIINSRKAKLMDGKGTYIIRNLFEAYLSTPNQLPDNIIVKLFTDYGIVKLGETITKYDIGGLRSDLENKKAISDDSFVFHLCRNICDYITSMTDRYAQKQYEKLYGSTILE